MQVKIASDGTVMNTGPIGSDMKALASEKYPDNIKGCYKIIITLSASDKPTATFLCWARDSKGQTYMVDNELAKVPSMTGKIIKLSATVELEDK